MARKRIADQEPAISKEGAAAAPAKSPIAAKATSDSNKARAPRASANAVTHRHKKTATIESETPPAPGAANEIVPAAPAPAAAIIAGSQVQPPTREDIAIRAYLLAESRGFQGGSPEGDWLEAERQLLAERAGE